MWGNKQSQLVGQGPTTAPAPVPTAASKPGAPVAMTGHDVARLGASFHVRGEISGNEDLQIDGTVEGQIVLPAHRLTVGRSAQLTTEVKAREVVVYGMVNGNVHAGSRVEIKRDGGIAGNLTTAGIVIEDGAHFKGHIDIENSGKVSDKGRNDLSARPPVTANKPVLVGVGDKPSSDRGL
jgi:cytoskeletal protein CcmA (bactofilin family)